MNLGFNVPASFSITSATRFLSATVSWFFRPVVSAFDYPQAGLEILYTLMTRPIKWNGEEKNLDLPFCHPIKFFDVSTCFHLLNPGTDFLHHKRSDQCHQIFPHYLPCRKVGWVARLTRLHHSQILLYQCVPYMQSHKRLHRNHQRRRSSSFLPLEFLNKTAKLQSLWQWEDCKSTPACSNVAILNGS